MTPVVICTLLDLLIWNDLPHSTTTAIDIKDFGNHMNTVSKYLKQAFETNLMSCCANIWNCSPPVLFLTGIVNVQCDSFFFL